MEYELMMNEEGMVDITGLEDEIRKGDILNVDGERQKVIDIHEADVTVSSGGKRIEYGLDTDENNFDKTYLRRN